MSFTCFKALKQLAQIHFQTSMNIGQNLIGDLSTDSIIEAILQIITCPDYNMLCDIIGTEKHCVCLENSEFLNDS